MIPFNTKAALLQTLMAGQGRPSELVKRINELTHGEVVLHDGAVYPALVALDEAGLVTTVAKYGYREYKLTRQGKRQAKLDQQLIAQVFKLRRR